MPSKDSYHVRHPKTNGWMADAGIKSSAQERPNATEPRAVGGPLLRLAKRLGEDPDELAKRIPADTLRRLKYPVIESVNDDGTRSFKHDIGITHK